MKMFNRVFEKVMSRAVEVTKEERGSQTLEWIGIAAVIVILVGVISTAMSGADNIGEAVVTKVVELIQSIGG
ncbi:hypothetical protein [Alkalibacillus haloalkaliphilus]|uniref:hypothetical protein n=1 Tax=Alkalibacillus haloalkaliphilus TaxID=94136 RepID=UPI002936C565|nr:hypothetical protein [Alkalibacillus haloalkaliphilus]MDV2581457.1 hypothetical protein [Alkalibacillus haloalkaliphilus]